MKKSNTIYKWCGDKVILIRPHKSALFSSKILYSIRIHGLRDILHNIE